MENKEKIELNDDELEAVTGGASDVVYLEEENLPGGWYVTCTNCKMGFPVCEGSCPSCGSTEVQLGTANAIYLYDPSKAPR